MLIVLVTPLCYIFSPDWVAVIAGLSCSLNGSEPGVRLLSCVVATKASYPGGPAPPSVLDLPVRAQPRPEVGSERGKDRLSGMGSLGVERGLTGSVRFQVAGSPI